MNPHDINPSDLPSLSFVEKNRLPSSMAIYFVMNALSEVLYIGQTINLNQRWNSHQLIADLKSQEGIRIAWLLAESELELGFESAFIKWFDPPLNIVKELRDSMIKIRIPYESKERYYLICQQENISPSEDLRAYVKQRLKKREATPSP